MPDRSITGQNLANRRGLLMGMTLAEVMLIILFCLLLLLGKYFLELKEERNRVALCGLCATAPWASELTAVEVEGIGTVAAAIRSLPSEERDDSWRRLTDELAKMVYAPEADERSQLRTRAIDAERRSADLESQLRQLKRQLEQSEPKVASYKERMAMLEEEIRKIKAGSPPPCLHEPSRVTLRGPSIALGTVHIENGRMTLVEKNTAIPSLSPVDYMGRPADYEEAYSVLEAWPLGVPMGLEEFAQVGKEFIRIGDKETSDRLKCRFTMNFFIEDGIPFSMLVDVFEQFFYKQNRLSRNEIEHLKRN